MLGEGLWSPANTLARHRQAAYRLRSKHVLRWRTGACAQRRRRRPPRHALLAQPQASGRHGVLTLPYTIPIPARGAPGDCLEVAAALAASLPARLLGDLAAVPLLRPADPLSAALDLSSQRGGAAGCARLLC
jgi:hypothetical protein